MPLYVVLSISSTLGYHLRALADCAEAHVMALMEGSRAPHTDTLSVQLQDLSLHEKMPPTPPPIVHVPGPAHPDMPRRRKNNPQSCIQED